MKRVVVAIDGSDVSRGVMDYAFHYAVREKDAELLFLNVIAGSESRPIFAEGYAGEITPSEEDRKASVESSVNEALKAYGAVIPGISVSVRKGVPYAEIVDFAKEKNADMIMIGHRGLSNLQRFFLGSVAAQVVAHAPCSVYVYRPKEP